MQVLRPLGASERLHWLLDQSHPTHFMIVAQVSGATEADEWRRALDTVFKRTPLLAARVVQTENGGLSFAASGRRMPVRIIRDLGIGWETVAEDEEVQAFDPASGPLGRATLLHGADRSTLILSVHHSVGDALGTVYLLRDILRVMAGETLDAAVALETVERLTENAIDGLPPETQPNAGALDAPTSGPRRTGRQSRPTVASKILSGALTKRLRERARAERTTVQGMLGAAIIRGAHHLAPGTFTAPIGVLSAIDLRQRVAGGSEAFGLCTTGHVTTLDCKSAGFWDMARSFKDSLRAIEDPAIVRGMVGQLEKVIPRHPTGETLAALLASQPNFDLILSNLGTLKIPLVYGKRGLTLEALWGPVVTFRLEREQTFGVSTIHDRIHLVLTSYTPIAGFLETIEVILEDALTH
jgi:hypothetical protein